MAASETVTINGSVFTARKLTVRDIRDLEEIITSKSYEPNAIDGMFLDGLPSAVVFRSLGITIDDMDELLPEDVKQLMEAVANVNPIYAASVLQRKAAGAKMLLDTLTKSAPSS